jgi:hypothetical protein
MTKTPGSNNHIYVRYLHEALSSLSLAFMSVTLLLAAVPALSIKAVHIDVSVSRLLHITQTDLIRGYFGISIPSMILGLCLWALLRTFSHARITKEIVQSMAGIAVLLSPPTFWYLFEGLFKWPYGWLYRGTAFEPILALGCALLFMSQRWRIPLWTSILFLAGHYGFWFWIFGNYDWVAVSYFSPVAPVLNFVSSLAWVRYVGRLRRVPAP